MTQELSVGAVVNGRYRIEAVLAHGGAGTVYKARHTAIERAVVLEVLEQGADGASSRNKRREAVLRRCARLQHPNTGQMFDFGQTLDGRLYVVTEFLEGVSLRQALRSEAFAPARALRILLQCCASLEEAHGNGIVHGNLKPERVFLTERGRVRDFVKVLDYANARLADEPPDAGCAVYGTPGYMSPEQIRGMALDGRSDVYALGIVAYEMLTGRAPFHGGDSLGAILKRQLEGAVAPMAASVPGAVQQIVLRALEKDPDRRYRTAGAMTQDCQRVLVELTGHAGPVGDQKVIVAGIPIATPRPSPTGRQPSPTLTGPVAQPSDARTAKAGKGRATSLLVGAGVAAAGAAVAWVMTMGTGGGGADPGGVIAVGALGAAGAGALGLRPVAAKTAAAMRRARTALAQRRESRRLKESHAAAEATVGAPPVAVAYRPSWVAPRRQSAIHVYVVLPEEEKQLHEEARRALDAPGNPARKAHGIPLTRALAKGEVLEVVVELAGFEVGAVAPIGWTPPYVRFLVPIRAHGDVALGGHRPVVTVRRAGGSGEQLARFDFHLEVRESRWGSGWKIAMLVGCGAMASAAVTATVQHALPPVVGWPAGAACLVGGAGTWALQRSAMVPAEARDRSAIFVVYAPEDRERVKRAIRELQERNVFPQIDVERALETRPIEVIERAYRVFVFWSEHARRSSAVTTAWETALKQVADRSFVMPIVLGPDRLEEDHPLARFKPVDLGAMVDALIVTAVEDEYEAVLAVETGAVAAGAWQRREGPTRLEVAFHEFTGERGVIRIAVTQALGMGGVNAIDAAARLIEAYHVRCLAMCGVCAGRRGDVELGDVIIADRLWQYDAGKRKVAVDAEGRRTVREQSDIDMYKIQPPEWKQAAERFRIDEGAAWLAARPRSWAEQSNWILERVLSKADPATDPEQAARCPDYDKAIARLWTKGLLVDGTLMLTDAGRDHIRRLLTLHRGTLPEPKPLRLHVGPIASGNKVMEDAEVFPLLADSVRKVLGVEMEAAAIGALASSSDLDFSVVMKAVMDHADPDKSDNFKAFAARASAECLIAFLRQHLPPRTPPIP